VLDDLEALARTKASPAEIRRVLVLRSRELEIPPPSYEHVRRLVSICRLEAASREESEVLPVLLDVALGLEHGNELVRVARGQKRRRARRS
jgi:hypothetical protein